MKRLKDKGYSFVELLIVMALVAILAGMALVSLTLINTARAKQASTVFGDEVNALRKKAMNMVSDDNGTPNDTSDDIKYGMVLYYDTDNRFKAVEVPCELNSVGSNHFYQYNLSNIGDPVILSSRVEVKFSGIYTSFNDGSTPNGTSPVSDYVPTALNSPGSVCIIFDKKGNCTSGYGEYDFYKKNGNRVARVFVKQNGSIEIR